MFRDSFVQAIRAAAGANDDRRRQAAPLAVFNGPVTIVFGSPLEKKATAHGVSTVTNTIAGASRPFGQSLMPRRQLLAALDRLPPFRPGKTFAAALVAVLVALGSGAAGAGEADKAFPAADVLAGWEKHFGGTRTSCPEKDGAKCWSWETKNKLKQGTVRALGVELVYGYAAGILTPDDQTTGLKFIGHSIVYFSYRCDFVGAAMLTALDSIQSGEKLELTCKDDKIVLARLLDAIILTVRRQ
jgi:hypothetical protein